MVMESLNNTSLEKVKLIEFNFSTRIKNIFEENNIIYFSQLLKMSMSDLVNLNRMGRKSIDELIQFIQVFIFWDEKLHDICRCFEKGVGENPKNIKKDEIKRMLIECCDINLSNEEIIKRIKFNLDKSYFGIKIGDSYLKKFIEEEKKRISQRNNFGIRPEWVFEVERVLFEVET